MNNRPIRPRKAHDTHYYIIAVYGDSIYLERTGEIEPRSRLPHYIQTERPAIIACDHAGDLLRWLNDRFTSRENWQYKLKTTTRELYRPDSPDTHIEIHRTVVCFCGFRDENRHNNYHHPIDPISFTGNHITETVEPSLDGLIQWGKGIRDFCKREGLRPSVTAGGLCAQLLRDKRFFPQPRRKIPRSTNAKVRTRLPGHHYQLRHSAGQRIAATYLDMESAHHACAKDIVFPDPNTLYASGSFRRADVFNYVKERDKDLLLCENGLIFGILRGQVVSKFAPDYLHGHSPHKATKAYFYTNEIPLLESLGIRIEQVIAAWTSPNVDRGLNRYAYWSINQLQMADSKKRQWLKPLLLTTYGILATRPRPLEFGFRVAKSGDRVNFPVGRGTVPGYIKRTEKASESGIVNVIWRGMIEAECRKRVITLANDLSSNGVEVLALYADSLFVRSKDNLPLLSPPWQIKSYLSDLEFFNSTSFTSQEMTKLPGIPKSAREKLARRNSFKALTRDQDRGKIAAGSND